MNDLQPRGTTLPTREEAESRLLALAEAGDTDALGEVRSQASAYQEYEARRNAAQQADYFGRLKVMAEAALGLIDLTQNPRGSGFSTPLLVGEEVVSNSLRKRWRTLGVAHKQGVLIRALDQLESDPDSAIGTYSAINKVQALGAGWVATKLLRDQFKRSGLTLADLARKVESSEGSVGQALGLYENHGRVQLRVGFDKATIIAAALEMEGSLAPAPGNLRRRKKRRRIAPLQLSGGRWDETYSRLRRTLDEFGRVAGEDSQWDEAYSHFYALEELIATAVKKESNAS